MVAAPADCPFLPDDLISRLHDARGRAAGRCAVAASGGRQHPTLALWHVDMLDDLRNVLALGMRKVGLFLGAHEPSIAEWPTEPFDPFFNVNTPDDLVLARHIARSRSG